MGLFNKAKQAAQGALDQTKDKFTQEAEKKQKEKEYAAEMSAKHKNEQEERKKLFSSTRKLGDIELDDNNKLIKIKNATSEMKKSSGLLAKTAKATLAVYTMGASLAIEHALKPGDEIFTFDEIVDYDLYENNESISSGGLGRAVAGGLLLGGAGAIVGGVTGRKKTKSTCNSMYLHISTTSFLFPSLMIPYITKEVKTKSNDYTKALSKAKETMSCLETVFKQNENSKEPQKVEIVSSTQANKEDPIEKVKKLKELLDMGIISQEEFDQKKKQILGL
ncbi:SHOCT domain-containing protein [Faecalicoccus pleomorphus]|uniref:SHOCT domain-containing protein n=1 Tax=Faecalicoccus pleomorphus TaxID=1323 RepID=UPI003DA545E7